MGSIFAAILGWLFKHPATLAFGFLFLALAGLTARVHYLDAQRDKDQKTISQVSANYKALDSQYANTIEALNKQKEQNDARNAYVATAHATVKKGLDADMSPGLRDAYASVYSRASARRSAAHP